MTRMLENQISRNQKRGTNGSLSFYRNRKHYVHTLWITELEQPHQINGRRVQSVHQAHWYPRSYAPGDISVTIRCRTQEDYQRLANLARFHHQTMLETPGLRFSGRAGTTGLRHLMLLRVPSEALTIRGWIPSFTITKRGVFDPAPLCTFTFFPAIDPYSSNPIISHQIRDWARLKGKPVKNPFAIDPDKGKPNRTEDNNIVGNPGDGRMN